MIWNICSKPAKLAVKQYAFLHQIPQLENATVKNLIAQYAAIIAMGKYAGEQLHVLNPNTSIFNNVVTR